MMKILLKNIIAGPSGTYSPGVADVPDDFARQLVAGGYAELLPLDEPVPSPAPEPEPEPIIESAAIEPEETAMLPKAKPRPPSKKK